MNLSAELVCLGYAFNCTTSVQRATLNPSTNNTRPYFLRGCMIIFYREHV